MVGSNFGSNYNLKFPRTSKEVYGHFAKFEPDHHWAEPWLWALAMFVFGFLTGVAL